MNVVREVLTPGMEVTSLICSVKTTLLTLKMVITMDVVRGSLLTPHMAMISLIYLNKSISKNDLSVLQEHTLVCK